MNDERLDRLREQEQKLRNQYRDAIRGGNRRRAYNTKKKIIEVVKIINTATKRSS